MNDFWDNIETDDFREYVKFDEVSPFESLAKIYGDKVEKLLCKVEWDTIEKFTNQWNKEQHRIQITKYDKMAYNGTISYNDSDIPFFLAMGKRLLRAMADYHKSYPKQKNIKIIRIGEGFDTHYSIEKFDPDKQTKINE